MKTVTSFIILVFSLASFACELNRPILSLSGPITMVLEELNLLDSKQVLGVSRFHPVRENLQVKKVEGGIFLSKKVIKQYPSGTLIIYDTSRELQKTLEKWENLKLMEINSRSLDPFEVFDQSIHQVSGLTVNCEKKINKLVAKVKSIKDSLGKRKLSIKGVFFLGEIGSKLPSMVISNDGFVKWLVQKMELKSYPSNFHYVSWSSKVLNKLENYIYWGLVDSKSDELNVKKISKLKYNLSYRGIFIPGIRQIYFLEKFSQLSFH